MSNQKHSLRLQQDDFERRMSNQKHSLRLRQDDFEGRIREMITTGKGIRVPEGLTPRMRQQAVIDTARKLQRKFFPKAVRPAARSARPRRQH